MAKSMNGQLNLFSPPTCAGSLPAIGSPGSAAGRTRSLSLVGLAIGLYGQVRAPVNPRVLPRVGETWRETSGQIGVLSSLNVALTHSLVSRLSADPGSIASLLTCGVWTTPSGLRFFRLSASVKTINENGFILWGTPTATANQACPSMRKWPGCRGMEVSPEAFARRMGYQHEWLRCLDLAMPLSRKSRKSSSKRISTADDSRADGQRGS